MQPENLEDPLLEPDGEPPPLDPPRNATYRLLSSIPSSSRRILGLGCLALLVRLPLSLSIPHFIAECLGDLSSGEYDKARRSILYILGAGTLDALLDFWCIYLFGRVKEDMVRDLRSDLYAALLRQDLAFFDGRGGEEDATGHLCSRLTSDVGTMASDLAWTFRFSIEAFVRIVGIFSYMLYKSAYLGSFGLCIIPIVAAVNKKYGDFLAENAKRVQDATAESNGLATEGLSNVQTVFTCVAEDVENRKYSAAVEKIYNLSMKQLIATGLYYMGVSTFLINTCVQAAWLYIGSIMVEAQTLETRVLLAFMLYQGQLQEYTLQLFQSYTGLMKSSGAGEKVFALIDRIPPPPAMGSPPPHEQMVSPSPPLQEIIFDKVTFAYPGRPNRPILNNFSLKLPRGSTTALVGRSGCGKTTAVRLLARLYDPDSGSLRMGPDDLRNLDLCDHRCRLGVVSQEPALFRGSLLDNILYGMSRGARSELRAREAARLANAEGFIEALPEGYEAQVGEGGVQLSGGQRQRIAIARAVVRKPDVLLLDEATSSLDAESERAVQVALDRLLRESVGVTTVIIAHRLQTVRGADNIAVVEEGGVVEQGSHEELMLVEGGYYRQLIEASGLTQ
uniref:ABC transporter n=1 Tax=Corethron hystrix TaxID=216773 RepID=A0A7S1G3H8_9STRA|mmetsp:Transcript_8894/g.19582  ORF Transcript_8894/g.19582 Transcript_8894/m.19582 type:complete len:619 (+) Transcript_8894:101-1957(+)